MSWPGGSVSWVSRCALRRPSTNAPRALPFLGLQAADAARNALSLAEADRNRALSDARVAEQLRAAA